MGKHLIEKNINIASRVDKHVRPQHIYILILSFALTFVYFIILAILISNSFFLLIFIIISYLLLENWEYINSSINKYSFYEFDTLTFILTLPQINILDNGLTMFEAHERVKRKGENERESFKNSRV